MKAEKTNIEVGTRIIIKCLKGKDSWLNGRTGTITHKFKHTSYGDVGIYLDYTKDLLYGTANLKIGEFKIVKELLEEIK